MDNQETEYYKSVCYIQDKFIKGEISREEMEKKLEAERQNQIIFLTQKDDLKVVYDGIAYYPVSLDIRFDKDGKVINTATIHSLCANSIMERNLKDISIYENQRSS